MILAFVINLNGNIIYLITKLLEIFLKIRTDLPLYLGFSLRATHQYACMGYPFIPETKRNRSVVNSFIDILSVVQTENIHASDPGTFRFSVAFIGGFSYTIMPV